MVQSRRVGCAVLARTSRVPLADSVAASGADTIFANDTTSANDTIDLSALIGSDYAFSTLIGAFTDNVITPLVNAAGAGGGTGLGFHVHGQFVNFGAVIGALIYFVIFMAVIYYVIVVPYRAVQKKRGVTVFGEPAPAQTCPACLSEGLPIGATKCRYCATALGGGAP